MAEQARDSETTPLLAAVEARVSPDAELPDAEQDPGYDRADDKTPAVLGLTIASLFALVVFLLSSIAFAVCSKFSRWSSWTLDEWIRVAQVLVRRFYPSLGPTSLSLLVQRC
jgi:hypothetical protein